jgi:hypothetical protein
VSLAKLKDKRFPGSDSLNKRLGTASKRMAMLRDFANRNPAYADVINLLPPAESEHEKQEAANFDEEEMEGFVYLLKLGKHYKIGCTAVVPRGHREIAQELPKWPSKVHHIRTDDPRGIERYWHERFATYKANGEWFALTPKEVRAFKRRKFM